MTQTQPTQPTLALPEGQCRPGIWVHFKASKQWRTGRIIRVRRSKKGTLVAQIIVEPGETYIIAQDRLYRATPPRPVHRDWLTIPEVVTLLVDAGAIKIGINADHTDWSAGLLPGVRARWKQTPELNTWDIEEAITTYMRKCRDFPRTRATARRFYTLKFEVRDVVQRIFAEAAHKNPVMKCQDRF